MSASSTAWHTQGDTLLRHQQTSASASIAVVAVFVASVITVAAILAVMLSLGASVIVVAAAAFFGVAVMSAIATGFLAVIVVETMVLRIALHVSVAHPLVANEEDRLSACAVSTAMMCPVALIALGHVQINRMLVNRISRGRDHDRLLVDHCGWLIAHAWLGTDLDAAIYAWHVDADVATDGDLRLRHASDEAEYGDCSKLEVDCFHTDLVLCNDEALELSAIALNPQGSWATFKPKFRGWCSCCCPHSHPSMSNLH